MSIAIAIWTIAIVEIVRAVQNTFQLMALRHEKSNSDNAYAEFVKSLKRTDDELSDWVKSMSEGRTDED